MFEQNLDPEYMERAMAFAFQEVPGDPEMGLPPKTRYLVILASLLGEGAVDLFRELLPRALDEGVTSVEVKEVVYQATDYIGLGRVWPFLKATNEVFAARGIYLPLEDQSTTTKEDRLEKGVQAHAAGMEKWHNQPLAGR